MAVMMDIVRRAARKIGIVAEDEQLTADQAAHGLSALNSMMASWELMGVDIGHSVLVAEALFPLPLSFEEATVWLLAERLAPDYGLPAINADAWMRAIQNAYADKREATLERTLTEMPSQLRWRGYF